MQEDLLTKSIIRLAIDVHSALGPGLLENVYQECLYYKIKKAGFLVEKEKVMPVVFEDVRLDCGYRIDLLIENRLVLELKSVECLTDIHLAQTLTYLKLGSYRYGLLINFNVFRLKDGIKRIVNGY
ncbi:GxxExxY protein [Pedobacter sp.]|uniref:GxxExxY protein n=1 Tax=Pedobacter sp. TaxID=1411316 RepID=UPI003BA8D9C5